jgi:hypothetical protein
MYPADRQPLTQRVYRIFSQRPGCAPAGDFKDLSGRIWEGDCLADERTGAVAPGDLIGHAFKVEVSRAKAGCLCERVEVLRVTETGLQLIGRETMFQMERYGDFPILGRDAGMAGDYYDHGLRWQRISKRHGRDYDTVREKDLRLFSRVVSREVRDRELSEMASGTRETGR